MGRAMFGALAAAVVVYLAMVASGQPSEVLAQRSAGVPGAVAGGGELIALPVSVGDKFQVVTLVDPRQRTLCVYHVELLTGKITLKSVRNIQWDMQMSYLNNEQPLPSEIRALLDQR